MDQKNLDRNSEQIFEEELLPQIDALYNFAFRCLLDKIIHLIILLYNGNIRRSPAGQFVTDAAGAAKQIQHFELLEIEMVVQDIEKCFYKRLQKSSKGAE